MPQSVINAQAGTSIIPALLNKTGGTVENIGLQTNGANAITINQLQLVVFNSTGAITVPRGATSQRPSVPTNGMVRYNTDIARFEGYANGWVAFT
jgi:hypothetical protein